MTTEILALKQASAPEKTTEEAQIIPDSEQTIGEIDVEDLVDDRDEGVHAAPLIKQPPRWLTFQPPIWLFFLWPVLGLLRFVFANQLHPEQQYARRCRITARKVANIARHAAASAGIQYVVAARENSNRKVHREYIGYKNCSVTADEVWLHVDPLKMPRGHRVGELEDLLTKFHIESALGHPLRTERGNQSQFFLVVSMTGRGGIPNLYKFKNALEVVEAERARYKKAVPYLFCAGAGANATPYCLNLEGMWSNMFIVGPTGKGKTRLMFNIVLQHAYLNSPQDFEFYFIDLKMTTFYAYKFDTFPHIAPRFVLRRADFIPGFKKSDITEAEWELESGRHEIGEDLYDFPSAAITEVQALNVLRRVFGEMQRRKKMFQEKRCETVEEYNRRFPTKKIRYVELVIDEVADLMTAGKYHNEGMELLRRLASQCRVFGIRVICGTQIATKEIINIAIKVNFWFVMFHTENGAISQMVLNDWSATRLPDSLPGRYICAANKKLELQGPYASDNQLRKHVKSINKKWQGRAVACADAEDTLSAEEIVSPEKVDADEKRKRMVDFALQFPYETERGSNGDRRLVTFYPRTGREPISKEFADISRREVKEIWGNLEIVTNSAGRDYKVISYRRGLALINPQDAYLFDATCTPPAGGGVSTHEISESGAVDKSDELANIRGICGYCRFDDNCTSEDYDENGICSNWQPVEE